MQLYRIKLTRGDEVFCLDWYGSIVDESLASPFEESEAQEMVDSIRNRGIYKGYHIDVEVIAE